MKKEAENHIVIPITGITSGVHSHLFTLGRSFFGSFGNGDIRDAHIEAAIELEKETGWIRLKVEIKGSVVRSCDRCLGDVVIPIVYSAPVVVKFARAHGEEECGEWIILDPIDTEIDLTQYVYDSVCVSLPLQSIHASGGCDPEMEKKIAELSINLNL
jgi:uncharacterized metal-binding protein YceD (DUF177 family)